MAMSLDSDDRFNGVTTQQTVKMSVWARNTHLIISGYSPFKIATGRTASAARRVWQAMAACRTWQAMAAC